MGDAFRTQIYDDLFLLLKSYKEYDSSGGSVESDAASDLANKIADSVANSIHNTMMTKMQTAMDSHKAMEDELRLLLQNLSTFMSSFSSWVPTGTLSDAVQLKAACSSSAAQVTAKCGTVGDKIGTLSSDLQTLSSDIGSYKG